MKAKDLEKWFDMKSGLLNNKETGKRDHLFNREGMAAYIDIAPLLFNLNLINN